MEWCGLEGAKVARHMRKRVTEANAGELNTGDAPSISTRRPMVRFHCFPARAIRLSLRSPSMVLRFSGGMYRTVAFAACRVDSVAPEKNACTL